jgi:hypothetical protein
MLAYLDTEFTDFVAQRLISVGIVCADGAEFYVELTDFPKYVCSDFVKQTVLPLLQGGKYATTEIGAAIALGNWLDDRPEPLEFVVDYTPDYELVIDLLRGTVNPTPKIKFLHTLFGMERGPYETYKAAKAEFYARHTQIHHALVDARAMKYAVEQACPSLKA